MRKFTEDKTHELKREYTDAIKKSIVAFANTDGGETIIGVADDGTVVGVEQPAMVALQVNNAVRDAIRPDATLFVECAVRNFDGKLVVVVNVQRGTARPYYLAGKGIRPEGVFVRQGAASVPASEAAILAMVRETAGDSYEAARSVVQQLDLDFAKSCFAKKGIAFEATQMKTLGLVGTDEMFTNLALLLSEQCPHTIKVGVFGGADKSVFKDRREFSGSLLRQIEDVFAFVDLHNPIHSTYNGLERTDRRDYPVSAVREALLNAIVHRDYGFSASTLINIFDDHLEIVSIGGLLRGVSLSDILLGVSALRNPKLANIFYRLNLIEAYGTGITKIMAAYSGCTTRPEITTSDNAFKVSLPNLSLATNSAAESIQPVAQIKTFSPNENAVIELLKKHNTIRRKDIQTATGISQTAAITLLRALLEKGVIQKTNNGIKSAYALTANQMADA